MTLHSSVKGLGSIRQCDLGIASYHLGIASSRALTNCRDAADFAATGQGLIVISRALADAVVGNGFFVGNFVHLSGRSPLDTLALCRVQLPHQFADPDAGPEVCLPDPALHVLAVTLPGLGGQRGSLVAEVGCVVDPGALGQHHVCRVVADQGGAGVHQAARQSVEALIA